MTTYTVKELKEALEQCDDDLLVIIEADQKTGEGTSIEVGVAPLSIIASNGKVLSLIGDITELTEEQNELL